jgi:hypothetical protein
MNELTRLRELSLAGRNHPGYTIYAGQPAFNHDAVLEAPSTNRTIAKRLHREFLLLGLLSPTCTTSRDGRSLRVQFIYPDRIAEALKAGQSDD